MVVYALYGVAALLALGPIAIAVGASPRGSEITYGAALIATVTLFANALVSLLENLASPGVTLPLGLPWLGAHFRIDALS